MWNLVIGIIFIIGGVSGGMVLRGTSSGLALAALGVGLCIWGAIQMKNASSGKRMPRRSALTRRPGAAPGRKLPPARPGAGAR